MADGLQKTFVPAREPLTLAPPATEAVARSSRLYPLPLLVIMAAALAVVVPFAFRGIPSGHDFEFHLDSWAEVLSQWKQGIVFPSWAAWAQYGYGEPRFIFYPPISWILGSTLAVFLPWAAVPGAFCWIALTLAGCSMFLLARNWLNRTNAIMAAALFAVNPYHILIVYWRSAFAELLTSALVPLFFLFVLRLQHDRKWIVPLGLVVAGVCLTDVPCALMVEYSIALLTALLAWQRRSWRILLYGGLGILLGMALSAFYLFPAIYEQKWINIAQVLSENIRPRDNFIFTRTGDDGHNRFNLVVSVLVLAQAGALGTAAFKWRRWAEKLPQAGWLLAVWAGACFLLVLPITLPAWNFLPELQYVQFPWRWLLCLNLAFGLLVTVAWRQWWPRVLVYAGMLAVLAFGWNRFQAPWWDSARDVRDVIIVVQDSTGYEGADEYTPLEADGYNTNHNAPNVTFQGNGSALIRVMNWAPQSKVITANVTSRGNLVLKLFNYPAWRLEVNGHSITAGTQDDTGQMVVPIEAGQNRVTLRFVWTWDRKLGAALSALTAIALLALGLRSKKQHATAPSRLAA